MRAVLAALLLCASALAQQPLTEWRLVGGFGRYANTDFERSFAPEADELRAGRYGERFVERFEFGDGVVEPADYLRGAIFYAAAEFAAPAGEQELTVQSAGSLKLWIDGKLVLEKDDRFRATPETLKVRAPLSAGTHRVLVKFTSRAPFRVALGTRRRHPRAAGGGELRSQAESLLERGEHTAAAAAAGKLVAAGPLDRGSRLLLARALHASGDVGGATATMRELAALAPNAARFARMLAALEGGALAPFAPPPADAEFGGERFFVRWRRAAGQVIAASRERRFSGGPAVKLLDDTVVKVGPDGSCAMYVHNLVRVLSKEGLQKYGEITLPPGARVLELRTLRADGSIAEPELTPHKPSISMPGAAAGDVIEQEYVVDGCMAEGRLRVVFGSFAMPVLRARLVVISNGTGAPVAAASAGAPEMRVERQGETTARVWERADIPQSVREDAMLPRGNLPAVEMRAATSGSAVREQRRAEIIDVVRAGSTVDEIARALPRDGEAAARAIFARVRRVREQAGVAAEEALSAGEGSRLGALLALGRAAGFEADVLLAPLLSATDQEADVIALVRLRKDGREMVMDPAGESFGQLPAALANQALVVPVFRAAGKNEPATVALKVDRAAERSIAEADVRVQNDGSLDAELTVRLGATRGTQLRARLLAMNDADRRQFFFEMAQRIFRDAEEIAGEAAGLAEPDRPLELRLKMRVPRYLGMAALDIDQLAPALGLAKMYASAPERRFPLFIESPLQETAVFRLHLPETLRVAPVEFAARSEFGSYGFAVRRLAGGTIEIRREFAVPAQVIAPQRYVEFSRFATEIEQAERRRLPLERVSATLRAD